LSAQDGNVSIRIRNQTKKVPQRLFQILITDINIESDKTTSVLDLNSNSLKSAYPEAEYRLYNDADIVDFLAKHYPKSVLHTYQTLTPFAFKSDLARYCLLHTFGGLYSDLSYLHLRPLEIKPACKAVVFRDIPGHPSWAVSNAIIYSEANTEFLAKAITRIVENHASRFYGHSPLEPTGPYMFGRVLAGTDDWKTIAFGDSHLINTDSAGKPDILKIAPAGEMIALRNKSRNGQISDLVPAGGNNYIELWKSRRIWGETEAYGLIKKIHSKLRKLQSGGT
jgi:mannosyltransferase OCH1-like enzyme